MESFLQKIIDTFYSVANWLTGWFGKIIDGVFSVIKNAFIWAFDGVLGVAVSALQSLSFSIPTASTYWSQVPAEIIQILSVLGFAEAMAIIASAIVVRLGLQLIPFVRLGS